MHSGIASGGWLGAIPTLVAPCMTQYAQTLLTVKFMDPTKLSVVVARHM